MRTVPPAFRSSSTHNIFHRGSPDCLTRIQRKPTTSSKHPASMRGGGSRGGGRGFSGTKRARRSAHDEEEDEGDDDEDYRGGEEGKAMERGTHESSICPLAPRPSPPCLSASPPLGAPELWLLRAA